MWYVDEGPVRAVEEINGVQVGWMWTLGEGVEEGIRTLIERFPELGASTGGMIVGWSPSQSSVFVAHDVGEGDDGYGFLGVGELWWSLSREQAELHYVKAMLVRDYAASGRLVMTEQGPHLYDGGEPVGAGGRERGGALRCGGARAGRGAPVDRTGGPRPAPPVRGRSEPPKKSGADADRGSRSVPVGTERSPLS